MKYFCITMIATSTLLCATSGEARECKYEGESWVVGRTKYTCVRNRSYEQAKDPEGPCFDGRTSKGKPCEPPAASLPTGGIGKATQILGLSNDQLKALQKSPEGRQVLRDTAVIEAQQKDAMKQWAAAKNGTEAEQRAAATNIKQVDTDLQKLRNKAQRIIEIQMH